MFICKVFGGNKVDRIKYLICFFKFRDVRVIVCIYRKGGMIWMIFLNFIENW